MKKNIPYSRQCISDDDIREVVETLRSDWLTQGPKVKEFEEALCRYTGAEYCAVLSSGTAALHLLMLAFGAGKGDRVITSPITFSASANCAVYTGARPSFVDIDDMSYHIDARKLEEFLKREKNRKNVKAVIPVHFMGTVAEIERVCEICRGYGIKVVEDAAHAFGAGYMSGRGEWERVGSSSRSDAVILSFHPIKHIATGEGGAVLTNDRKIYEKVVRFRQHGVVRNNKNARQFRPGQIRQPWFYDIPELGFNYRITDFQCALGISQLKKLDDFVEKRRRLAYAYNEAFRDIKNVRVPFERENTSASYHLYVIRVPSAKRDRLYSYLREKGIYAQVNYIPVHMLSYYQSVLGYRRGDFPVAEKYFEECLSLPLYPSLSGEDQSRVIGAVRRFFA
ncbi:MAG: UDP-4-amino-4,6-dideoxy-N-acetyl-beta-L-altrosamine transaminase [Candidatus Omnitrophota bacterium]